MPRERETWVDAGKGIAILGVVFFHAVLVTADVGLDWRWRGISDLLDTFRMPLFFLTAGLFAAGVLAQPFRVLLHRRIARLLWLYVLWSAAWVVVFQVVPWPRPDVPRPAWSELPLLLVWPNATTWFVYALALFLAVTWCARRVPTGALVGGAVLVSVVASQVDTGNAPIDKMGTYYVFFAAAARLGPRVRELAPRLGGRHAAVLAPVYVVVAVAVTGTGLVWVPGVRLGVSAVAVVAGVAAAVALSRVRSAGWLVTLGGSTLPVYLLHSYPLLVAVALLAPHRAVLEPWAPLVAPALTVVAVVVPLVVHRGTRGAPGLYDLPRRLERALDPQRPAASRRGLPGTAAGSVADGSPAA
jgi:uncharacterized membrane protein YcfT